jgi:hypothetical protein
MNSIKILLIINLVFTVAQAIAIFSKTQSAGYIIFIVGSVPPCVVYLYDERSRFRNPVLLKQLRLAFYFISYATLLFPFTYPFRFLAITLYTYKARWYYYVYLFCAVLTMCILGGFNELQGVLLTYGISLLFAFMYEWIDKQIDYLLFFCEFIIFWTVLIPLFYTKNHYLWMFWVSSLYGAFKLFFQSDEEGEDEKGDSSKYYKIFCSRFWNTTICTFCNIIAAFLVAISIIYGFSLEQHLPYSLYV